VLPFLVSAWRGKQGYTAAIVRTASFIKDTATCQERPVADLWQGAAGGQIEGLVAGRVMGYTAPSQLGVGNGEDIPIAG